MKRFLILLARLAFSLPLVVHADPIAITSSAPIEKLDADGHPSGVAMAQVGATYSLVRQQGDSVILKDTAGSQYLIAIQATNYSPAAAAAISAKRATNKFHPNRNPNFYRSRRIPAGLKSAARIHHHRSFFLRARRHQQGRRR